MIQYVRAIQRFWWVVPAGIAMATIAFVVMVYRVELGVPPKLTNREQVSYAATARVLLDTGGRTWVRANFRVPPGSTTTQSNETEGDGQTPNTSPRSLQRGNLPLVGEPQSLVSAANLFPLMMLSDEVTARRVKITGPIPGTVDASALGYFQGNNRVRFSPFPVIEVQSVAPTPRFAVTLVDGTIQAFSEWLANEQRQAGIASRQRIILRPLSSPASRLRAVGGPSYGLPLLLAAAVLAAFGALAVGLDRLRPRAEAKALVAPSPNGHHEDPALGQVVEELARAVNALLQQPTARTTPPSTPSTPPER